MYWVFVSALVGAVFVGAFAVQAQSLPAKPQPKPGGTVPAKPQPKPGATVPVKPKAKPAVTPPKPQPKSGGATPAKPETKETTPAKPPVKKPAPPYKKPFEGEITYEIKLSGKDASQFRNLFPKKMTIGIRCGWLRCRYDAPGADSLYGDIYLDGDSNVVYRVLPTCRIIQEKRVQLPSLKYFKSRNPITPPARGGVHGVGEPILGYATKKEVSVFEAYMALGKCKVTQYFAPEIHVEPNPGVVAETGSLLLMPTISGFPLMRVFEMDRKDIKVTMRAIKVDKKLLPNDYFQLPKGFVTVRFDTNQATYP